MRCRFDSDGFCHNVDANRRDRVNTPSAERCSSCANYEGPARGLGDIVASVTKSVGISPCGNCHERRVALNNAVSFPLRTDESAQPLRDGDPRDRARSDAAAQDEP
jgi:hypothetical protein